MHFLIYSSSASHLMSDPELTILLGNCRDRNVHDGITGMLLYKDGSFMQVLEGNKENVFRTYARIQKDTRHKGISLLREREIEDRNFGGWSMGFKSIDASDLEREPSFSRLSSGPSRTRLEGPQPHSKPWRFTRQMVIGGEK